MLLNDTRFFKRAQCDEQGRNISYPNGSNDGQMPSLTTSKVSLKTARCPPGTVAIRRTTKEDLVRLKSFSKSGGEYIAVANPLDYTNPPGFHVSQFHKLKLSSFVCQ